jgi:hypothetical protein
MQIEGHFLIFDDWQGEIRTKQFSISEGVFHPLALQAKQLYAFVTPKHFDRYCPAILEWKMDTIPTTKTKSNPTLPTHYKL